MTMDRLNMQSPDLVNKNCAAIAQLFPHCATETAEGIKIDFDLLRQELSNDVVEGTKERYRMEWPGKKKAIVIANIPTQTTLRPVVEQSANFSVTQNLYIEGDNLEVMKLLQESYFEKVKLIYIDPPYNTGSDLIYNDTFYTDMDSDLVDTGQKDDNGNKLTVNPETASRYHSDWLSMMYPRIKAARNLLRKDGFIFISIDDHEVNNLRKICDEIFGEFSFVADIVWQKKTSPDARMNISAAHDHILVYGKNSDSELNSFPFEESRRSSFVNPDNDPRGPWASVDLTGQTGRAPKSQFYTITTPAGIKMPPPEGRCWALAESTFNELLADNRIWFGANGTNRPRLKKFLSESTGVRPWTWWDNKFASHNQEGAQELKDLFDQQSIFDNPKPVRLLERIIEIGTKSDGEDIILDFFSGSATTAHAVFRLNARETGNRKFVLVQLPEELKEGSNDFKATSAAIKAGYRTICDIGKERIRRAAKKIKEETGADIDYGFRVYRLDSSNMQDVYYRPQELTQGQLAAFADNVKPDRSAEDLLTQVLLDWGLPLSLPLERTEIAGKEVWKVAGDSLYACFDTGIDEAFAKAVAAEKPLRIVFKDAGFAGDTAKINVEQLLKQLSPKTEVRVI